MQGKLIYHLKLTFKMHIFIKCNCSTFIFEGGPRLARLSGFQWTHTGQVQHWFRRTHITLCLQYSIFFSTGPSLYICHSHTSFCLAVFWGIHVYDMLYFSHQPFYLYLHALCLQYSIYLFNDPSLVIWHSHAGGRWTSMCSDWFAESRQFFHSSGSHFEYI